MVTSVGFSNYDALSFFLVRELNFFPLAAYTLLFYGLTGLGKACGFFKELTSP